MNFEEITDFGNLLQTAEKCCNGGRWKPSVQMFEVNILQWVASKKKELENGSYRPRTTRPFQITERGKIRLIRAHHICDRMVYKSFVKYELSPATETLILSGNSASQKGKGTDYAINKFKKDLAHAYKVCGGRDFYVYTYDFHNYFGSIPHKNTYDQIAPRLSDDGSRFLLKQYLNLFEDGIGVGIGGEPSQVIAVVYPSCLDRMIECDPAIIASGRYMDDGYFIAKRKNDIKNLVKRFEFGCKKKGLEINPKHTKLHWMEKDSITFLKKRTFITETGKIVMRLTRENVTMELHRLDQQKKAYDRKLIPMKAIEMSFQCWCSYAIKYNSYHSMITVTRRYCDRFNVSWEEARALWKKKSHKSLRGCKKN